MIVTGDLGAQNHPNQQKEQEQEQFVLFLSV
jgi:hypothetical protein